MKVCSKCKLEKQDDQFIKQKKANGLYKLKSACKECENTYKRMFAMLHPEKRREYERNSNKRNPETKKKKDKRYRERYAEKVKQKNKNWRAINSSRLKEKSKLRYSLNKVEINKKQRQKSKYRVETLDNDYIICLLKSTGFRKVHITKELIEIKRKIVLTKRAINNYYNENKD